MSLIAHFPLTDNVIDKVHQLSLSGTYTQNSAGKIGKCAQLYNQRLSGQFNNVFKDLSTFSIAMWVYYSNTSSASAWADIFGLSVTNAKGTASLRAEITSNGSTNGKIFVNGVLTNDGGVGYDFTLPKNKWTHLAMVKTDTNITLYVNGTYVNTYNFISAGYPNALTTGELHIGDSAFYGLFNDLRIYNHAISQTEAKLLSQALIMQYDFNDDSAEATSNVGENNSWSTYSSYWTLNERTGKGLKLIRPNGSTSDCVAIQNSTLTSQMREGDIWTFSCYLYKNGMPWKSTASGVSSESYGYRTVSWESRDDGYYRITFQVIAAPGAWVLHNYFFSPVAKNIPCEMRYMQFEKKDHATGYVIGDRTQNLLNDTNLLQPVETRNINFSTNAISGKYSLNCQGNTYIRTLIDTKERADITLSAWINPTSYPSERACIIIGGYYLTIDSIGRIGGWCYGRNDKTTGDYHYNTNSTNAKKVPLNQWSHIAITWDDTYCTGYVNGIEDFKIAAAGAADTSAGHDKKDIGLENGSSRGFNGLLDDVRIYATTLNSTDIANLYSARALISEDGALDAHEFIELNDGMFSEECFTAVASGSPGNGKLELRNQYAAYGLQANQFWHGETSESYQILRGQFKENTSYVFDTWIDADTMWYSGGNIYVPAGLIIYYTDAKRDNVVATSVGGTSGWQHITFTTPANKTI